MASGLLAARRAAREREREEDGAPGTAVPLLLLEIPAVLAFGIVALPVAWDHYFLLLAPALAMLAVGLEGHGLLARPAVAVSFGAAVLALALPTPQALLDRAGAMGWPARLVLSHYLIGALVVIALAVRGLWAAREGASARVLLAASIPVRFPGARP